MSVLPQNRVRGGLLLIFFLLVASVMTHAQIPIRLQTTVMQPPDSTDLQFYKKKHFWRAAGEVVGFNLALWGYDRYIEHGDFAYISFKTIAANFRHGFKWDNDKLGTNTFLHPYTGNLYFNAARSNGYNFWQSELFAIAGSAMWEMFMEREYPSTNDVIATPVGGAAIGEVFYRASDLILNDASTGAERVGREAAAFIVSPLRGFNRLITGRMWQHRATSGRQFGIPNVAFQLSSGVRILHVLGRTSRLVVGASLQADLEYGYRFDPVQSRPFDYFSVRLNLSFMKSQPLLTRLQITGRLLGRTIVDSHTNHLSAGLYQHFDFYDSDTISKITKRVPYKLGIPASVGAGLQWRNNALRHWTFDAFTHFNAVVLGSTLSDYYRVDERNYNWASGFSVKSGINAVFGSDRVSLSASHEFYRLFTWRGYRYGLDMETHDPRTLDVQGDRSVASFNVLSFRGSLKIRERLYATFGLTFYRRTTRYHDYPRVASTTLSTRTMLTYKF